MRVLGISAYYHDAAACLVVDGDIVAAAQEERFTRKKHDAGFPQHAIDYCLAHARLKPQDIDQVVFYDKPFLKFERLLETYLAFAPRGFESFRMSMPVWLKEKLFQKSLLLRSLRDLPGGERWAIEIKRSRAARPARGFHEACADLQPARRYVVHAGADRYAVGDGIEATRILWLERHDLTVLRALDLPVPHVFEDIAPRAVMLPGAPGTTARTALLTVRSGPDGGQLALVAADPAQPQALHVMALGDTVGGFHRWLAPATDGGRLLAVHTPHIGGVLHHYTIEGPAGRQRGEEAQPVAEGRLAAGDEESGGPHRVQRHRAQKRPARRLVGGRSEVEPPGRHIDEARRHRADAAEQVVRQRARRDVPALHDSVLNRTPAGRWGTPDDFEGIAVFLAAGASDYVTGAAITVDGGYSVQG